ncbi:MAG: hypothetical protein KTR31_26980 [Myxococcales bacterium]|nr:hypothetical protein [Myxococcales bacterium]
MGAFNTVSARLRCPQCGTSSDVTVQFRYGRTWQLAYSVGDNLEWGGNDVGDRATPRVVVEGVVEQACPSCAFDDWDAYVFVEAGEIKGVKTAMGEHIFGDLPFKPLS